MRYVASRSGAKEKSADVFYGEEKQDDLRFLRIRTKRHELMITPGTCHGLFSPSFFALTSSFLNADDQYILVRSCSRSFPPSRLTCPFT